ncbi:hypothetical protein GCM10011583_53490 [Streptomyces camponoticapitis]|uniref:Uncharacterized protein n=1 Tax=Streptomyces camponoticapitis TaxID=1616125 RepID=A0ABQ2EJV7_9ACTN|nr:hypothetical protein GCM10011583_53490 [Streptomyces camponoticapitis]
MGEESLSRFGEPGALPRTVEKPRTHLGLELTDLPAQGRLRDMQLGGGAAEVQVRRDGDEVANQPEMEIRHT